MWRRDPVVYQIYPRSFQDSDGDGVGDLPGIRSRLAHLRWLGVDALWLSPIQRSPMADLGYDISGYTDVDPLFGTPDDLAALVGEAHDHDLRVLLDIVPCHTSIEHPWFAAHPERYIFAPGDGPPNNWRATFGGAAWSPDPHGRGWYLHSFYPEQPDLNWRHPDVPAAMAQVLATWRSRGIDGFRLDALQQLMKDPLLRDDPPADVAPMVAGDPDYDALEHRHSANAEGTAEALAAMRAGAGDDALLVGEVFLPSSQMTPYLTALDAAFCFELFFARWEATALADAIAGGLRTGAPAWVLSNHDFPRLPSRVGAAQVRAAALLLLTLPGPVFLYQGDEIGQGDAPPAPSGTTYDRAGRDAHRHPMQWDGTPSGGFTTGTPWLAPVDAAERNVEAQRGDRGSLLWLHRELVALRRVLHGPLEDLHAADGVVSFRRDAHVIAVNVSDEERPAPPAAGATVLTTHPHGTTNGVLPAGGGIVARRDPMRSHL